MEKLYRAQLRPSRFREEQVAAQNPIELDNKAFSIENGDMKSLDYLDYTSTMTKGALAACGSIKLHPINNYNFNRDYGAYSPWERKKEIADIKDDESEEIENSWDNIFLNRKTTDTV